MDLEIDHPILYKSHSLNKNPYKDRLERLYEENLRFCS
jgi:hypothetical protein